MMDFDSSFNFFIGIDLPVEEFNWFNNKYIHLNIYELDSKFEPKKSENIKMRMCEHEDTD